MQPRHILTNALHKADFIVAAICFCWFIFLCVNIYVMRHSKNKDIGVYEACCHINAKNVYNVSKLIMPHWCGTANIFGFGYTVVERTKTSDVLRNAENENHHKVT